MKKKKKTIKNIKGKLYSIGDALEGRNPRRRSVADCLPIQTAEPWMRRDGVEPDAIFGIADQSEKRKIDQQMIQKGSVSQLSIFQTVIGRMELFQFTM